MNRMPGFSAASSLFAPSRSYRTTASRNPSSESAPVIPQALRPTGAFGGFGRLRLGLEPRPPRCSRCQEDCKLYDCGPGCIEERCVDACTSVPCPGESPA